MTTNLDTLAKYHKIRDDRWTIKDKLVQYRGLVDLYARDRKNLLNDNKKTHKKNVKEIRQLNKDVQYYRETLTNAKLGDKQRLRNALQNHRPYLLAYENRLPNQVPEIIFQINFTKTKLLDRLGSKLKLREDKLLKLLLEIRRLQARPTVDSRDPNRKEQVIFNKIHYMDLKMNAAVTMRNSYEEAVALLKKDSLYFDRVLLFLGNDQHQQMKCVLRATEMGQLATEDVANLREEYKTIEREVKANMRLRDRQVKKLREEVDDVYKECKLLTRTESDTELSQNDVGPTLSELALPKEIEKLQENIRLVQTATLVPTFEDIFPQMREQLRQRDRLTSQLNTIQARHDELSKKRDHGELMLATLKTTMGEDAMAYREEKKSLLSDIGAAIIQRDNYKKETKRLGEILLNLRSSLQTLYKMMDRVQDPNENSDILDESDTDFFYDNASLIVPPEPTEENAEVLMTMVYEKLNNLSRQIYYELDEEENERAKSNYETQIAENQSRNLFEEVDVYDQPLVVEAGIEDPMVCTREELKKRSDNIVRQYLKPLEMKEVPKVSLLKAKGKKWH